MKIYRPQTVICRDKHGYFVQYAFGLRELQTRTFKTHDEARDEQRRLTKLIYREREDHVDD